MRSVAAVDPQGEVWRVRVLWLPRHRALVRRIGGWRRRKRERDGVLDSLDALPGADADDLLFGVVAVVVVLLLAGLVWWVVLPLLLLVGAVAAAGPFRRRGGAGAARGRGRAAGGRRAPGATRTRAARGRG